MTPSHRQLEALARIVASTAAHEIDCELFLTHAAELLEQSRLTAPLPVHLHAVRQHLDVCPECLAEFDALLASLGVDE